MRTPTDIKTIELDECVTVRYRDTMNQLRISIAELECYIANIVDF